MYKETCFLQVPSTFGRNCSIIYDIFRLKLRIFVASTLVRKRNIFSGNKILLLNLCDSPGDDTMLPLKLGMLLLRCHPSASIPAALHKLSHHILHCLCEMLSALTHQILAAGQASSISRQFFQQVLLSLHL